MRASIYNAMPLEGVQALVNFMEKIRQGEQLIMEQLRLEPITKVNGSVTLPGSKSLSNRILLLAALAEGTTVVENLLDSDDIRHMLGALNLLGVNVSLNEDKTVATVEGVAGKFKTPSEPLFLGNAGTAYRPLTAVLAAVEGEYQLVGEPRMEERPIGHLVDALQALGGDVEYLKHKDYPPLAIKGGKINGGKVAIDGSISSQFLTALLMAAPLFNGDTEITIKGTLVSKPYIDITLDVMKRFGVTAMTITKHFTLKAVSSIKHLSALWLKVMHQAPLILLRRLQ